MKNPIKTLRNKMPARISLKVPFTDKGVVLVKKKTDFQKFFSAC